MKAASNLFLLFCALIISKTSTAQQGPFFGQLKTILTAGESNQFANIKGKLISTDPDGKKTFACTLVLEGFDLSLFEEKGKLEFMATSVSYAAVNNNVQFLTSDMVRDMTGLPGYKNTNRPGGDFESVIALMKAGSDLKLLIIKLKDKQGYTLMTTTFKSK